jgi:hypothetical protein
MANEVGDDKQDFTPVMDVEKAKKKIARREYMKNYMRKRYQENSEQIKLKNQAYYYKYRFGLTTEDMKKYDILLPHIAKLDKILCELKEANDTLAKEFLEDKLKQYYE